MIPLMQTAAYAKAYDRMFSEQVEALVIMYFNIDTSEVQVIKETNIDEYFAMFLIERDNLNVKKIPTWIHMKIRAVKKSPMMMKLKVLKRKSNLI